MELIQNVIKYSGAKYCALDVKIDEGYLIADVRDDGIGFDVGEIDVHKSGIGIELIKHRAAMLNGKIKFNKLASGGTLIRFETMLPIIGHEKY